MCMSDCSSDVCSSDLLGLNGGKRGPLRRDLPGGLWVELLCSCHVAEPPMVVSPETPSPFGRRCDCGFISSCSPGRSPEERRVGKAFVSKGSYRCPPCN